MDQNYNNRQNDFLWGLLANPANDARFHAVSLQRLVNDFPQSGILQALLAHASDDKNLKQASVYFNTKSLFKLINAPSTFTGVPDDRIVLQQNLPSSRYYEYDGHTEAHQDITTTPQQDLPTNGHEHYFNESPVVESATNHDENLPAVIHESENLPAVIHHEEEQRSANTDHTLAEARPPMGAIVPAAEAYIEHKFSEPHDEKPVQNFTDDDDISDFHRQVLSYIHPVEETITPAADQLHETNVQNSAETSGHTPETADKHLLTDYRNAEETLAHGAEDKHDDNSSYIHHDGQTAENTHEGISSYIHEAKENLAHKFDDASHVGETYLHHLDQPATHPAEQSHESAAYNHIEDNVEHITEETHHDTSAYVHPVEEPAEHTTEPAHTVEESVENKVHEAETSAAAYISSLLHHTPVVEHGQHVEPSFAESREEKPVETAQHFHTAEPEVPQPEKPIEEEVFDEITGIEQIDTRQHEVHEPEVAAHHEEQTESIATHVEPVDSDTAAIKAEEDKLIKGGMAVSDFFMFNRIKPAYKPVTAPVIIPTEVAASPVVIPEQTQVEEPAKKPEITVTAPDAEKQDVSNYHDDKLPYSFLWWLDKTRKEHAGVSQPYVGDAKVATAVEAAGTTKLAEEALQQQYYENIFHITSVEELDKSTAISAPYSMPPTQLKKKEQVIMERFIKEEPQIRPQASDKLDNENKAKKSSEDRDELVTETLAAIYSDQMLYHKAIASYKKLILKFPEKSRYFADKIEALEKKTN